MKGYKVSIIGVVVNIVLFVLKLIAAILSNSIALMSDALNSLSDIISSFAVMIGVKVSEKSADSSHPFGHTRAQPIAGLVVAIFAGVLGFEILLNSVKRLFVSQTIVMHEFAIIVTLIAILVKFLLYVFLKRNSLNHPAIKASAIDARNDTLLSVLVLIVLFMSYNNISYVDSVLGFFIGIFIIKSGVDIALENIDYLMGKAPNRELLKIINLRLKSLKNKNIKKFKDIKCHYVGNFVHIGLSVVVSKNISIKKSHDISEKVKNELIDLEEVDQVFIHIDYK